VIRALVLLALVGCKIGDVDFTGKACPCPDGYVCDAATQTCARSVTPGDDATNGDTPTDTPAASCLIAPFGNRIYETNFADFSTAWNAGGGTWAVGNQEVVQSDTTASLSFVEHDVGVNDYRVVTTMRATSGGAGHAVEIALRIDAPASNMYHCNWEPVGGAFIIQRTDDIINGTTIQEIDIDTNQIPNYSQTNPVTMEFQALGPNFECCLRGIQGASLAGSDNTYGFGTVGVKTYLMSGGFTGFEVYVP
jgi:hypothetical protein